MIVFPEPPEDVAAQLRAVADPGNPKQTAFFARGTRLLTVPQGLHRIDREEGTLVTADPERAATFRDASWLHEPLMARLLDYTEPKSRRTPHVVQAFDRGAVVHEQAASDEGLQRAVEHAQRFGAEVRVTTAEAAIDRRAKLLRATR